MYACPGCSQLSFTAWRKFGASSTVPARCPSCKTLVYVSGWVGVLVNLILQLLVIAVALVAWELGSWFAFFILLSVALGTVVMTVATYAKLRPIQQPEVRKARLQAGILLAGMVLLLVAANLLGLTTS